MSEYSMYRCDNCGKTQDSNTGWWNVSASRIPEFYSYSEPQSRAELCSEDCVLSFATGRMIEEGRALIEKKKK